MELRRHNFFANAPSAAIDLSHGGKQRVGKRNFGFTARTLAVARSDFYIGRLQLNERR